MTAALSGGAAAAQGVAPARADPRTERRLHGNRIWRVDTAQGPVLQKLYAERGGWLRSRLRELASRLWGGKTSTLAAGRRATEARLLALWREAGLDVPADLSARHPDLANERTLVIEYLKGEVLADVLSRQDLPRAQREQLLGRFARDWCRRHRLALQRGESALVQEHGGFQHVLVSGERLVTFDLENAFLPRADLLPIIAKEIASCLGGFARRQDDPALRRDLAVIVAHYEDRDRLGDAVRHYLANARLAWRVVWAMDRWRETRAGRRGAKYRVLGVLGEVLAAAPRPDAHLSVMDPGRPAAE